MKCEGLGDGNVGLAFGLTIIAGLSINIGAAAPFLPFIRHGNMAPLAAGLAFASGVLIFIAFTEVFKEAVEFVECDTKNEQKAYYIVVFSMVGGLLLTAGLELMVHKIQDWDTNRQIARSCPPAAELTAAASSVVAGTSAMERGQNAVDKHGNPIMTEEDKASLKQMSILTTVALAIHNFPEGFATFAAALASSTFGATLTVALILHNIPEGIGIAMPIYYATNSKWKAFPYTFVIGMMLPVSAGICWGAFRNSMSGLLFGILFGMAVGMVMFITIHEMLPTAFKYTRKKSLITIFFVLGMLVMSIGLGVGEAKEESEEGEESGLTGKIRTYYVGAVEMEWDYAPTGMNMLSNLPLEDDENSATFTTQGKGYIGRKYKKALYRRFTDDTFAEMAPHPSHLGFLGPMLRVEVGETLQVVFKNMASTDFSMHAHGAMYNKESEGALYMDGANAMGGEPAVAPNDTVTYEWMIPESSGPTDADTSSILWAYHSHLNEPVDVYSGLVGPLVVYRQGMLSDKGLPEKGLDLELVAHLDVEDENQSVYLDDNVRLYAGNRTRPGTVNSLFNGTVQIIPPGGAAPPQNSTMRGNMTMTPAVDDAFTAAFQESNMMHNINGYMYGNLKYEMCVGQRVRWYAMAMGNEVDLHTAHWHGQTLVMMDHRVDTVELLPATFRVLDMEARAEGTWLFHCHVNDHINAGMAVLINVGPEGACKPQEA